MVRRLKGSGRIAGLLGGALALVAAPSAVAAYGDPGGFRNVLAVGQGETVNAAEFGQSQATGAPPASFLNQLPHYRDLLYAAPELTRSDLDRHFKPAPLGDVPEDEVASVVRPRADVTITRDRTYGVPRVVATTREGFAFGVGYASAQDRLFAMDVLRSYGRSELGQLSGPGRLDAFIKNDVEQFAATAYTEQELQRQIDDLPGRYGAEGAQAVADLQAFADGINEYIAEARVDPSKLPAEYAALSRSPRDWRPTDSVAAASLIGGIFGRGGGKEHFNGEILRAMRQRLGRRGRAAFRDLKGRNDPDAPVTVRKRFPFGDPPPGRRRGVALPDLGSVRTVDPWIGGRSDGGEGRRSAPGGRPLASNALLVSGSRSRTGRPLAVMGPQVEWYSPQILMEIEVHAPGIDVRGATFPAFPYVLIGRGRDFAWSATTAQSDNVDVFAERLCEPDGASPTAASDHYLHRGECRSMVTRRKEYTTVPSAGSQQAPRQVVLEIDRTVHGNVVARGTVRGRPVAFAEARSTFGHEVDSTIAFMRLNGDAVTDARSFKRAVSRVNFAFNWFYADGEDVAFLQSGWYPRRAKGTVPELPTWGTGRWDWRGFDPERNLSRRVPDSRLPQGIGPRQGYMVNWNNKQAPGWRAADDNWTFGSVHRSQRLERPLRRRLARGGKVDLTELTQIMALAATVDVRGFSVYPVIRRVIGASAGDDRLDGLLGRLDRWVEAGAHRRDLDRDDVFEHSAAVALMDAWEARYVRGIFEPVIGRAALDRITRMNPLVDTPPFNKGSGFGSGWYSQVVKDLRHLLGRPVRRPFALRYCGRGSLRRCRRTLIRTLRAADRAVTRAQGTADPAAWEVPASCPPRPTGETVPKLCDQIEFQLLGGVATPPIPWQDRPTFQQVVEVGSQVPAG